MHAITFLSTAIAAASTLISTVSAGCYGVGLQLSKSDLRWHAQRACEGYEGKRGHFQGWFAPDTYSKTCVEVGVGKLIMEVGNLNKNQGFDIKDSDCTKELHAIIEKCGGPFFTSGGRFDNSGWTFRVDPNDGNCNSGDYHNVPGH
ncbi:hypothetical protein ACLX1H_008972 [Fusarium chlamydosporum]